MTAKYVLVASMSEGQIQSFAQDAEELLDLREQFIANPHCIEIAMYRLVCVERVPSPAEIAHDSGIAYLHTHTPDAYDVAG
jgi:hypothetical protein